MSEVGIISDRSVDSSRETSSQDTGWNLLALLRWNGTRSAQIRREAKKRFLIQMKTLEQTIHVARQNYGNGLVT